jgi:hypothetical protein
VSSLSLNWSLRNCFVEISLATFHAMSRRRVRYPADFAFIRKSSTFWIHLEAILVDFQGPNLRFERRSRDAQRDRGSRGSRHTAAGIFQCSLDHVVFLQEESPRELNLVFRL